MKILKQRVLVARVGILAMAACGLVSGYLLGRVLALQLAENGLDQYAKLTVVRDDASYLEARSLLSVLKDSPYPFCSDAEIAYFRELVFRSEYLRDAGRIQGGKIDCSTTAGHLTRSIGQFTLNSPKEDGLIPYSNLVPIRDASLKRAGERLAKFGLELHPDKTRLIEFGRFAARDRKQRGEGKPATFTFLGFTHYCGQRHKSGTFTVWRITAKKRMVAKLKAIKVELQRRMHHRVVEVGAWLWKVVSGYYQYHAVPGRSEEHTSE